MIQTGAGTVAVHSHGTGEPVVLLHANPGDHRDDDLVVPQLVEAGHRVHAVDRPVFGGGVATGPMSASRTPRRFLRFSPPAARNPLSWWATRSEASPDLDASSS
ncbi:MAG: alpha/beta fold hydrolase [Phycicoccus sp.]